MRRLRNVRFVIATLASLIVTMGIAASAAPPAPAAPAVPDLLGDWRGALDTGQGPLHVVFHLSRGKDGALTGTMDSPDQGATGIPVGSITFTAPAVHLAVDRVGGAFDGNLDAGAKRIVGVWKQGTASIPLTLDRTQGQGS